MFYPTPHIYPCGDHAIAISFGNAIDTSINQKVISLFKYISDHPPEGMCNLVPAYHTLTLIYDTALLKKRDPSASVYETMRRHIEAAIEKAAAEKSPSKTIDVPVCYDTSVAPDLASLAALHSFSVEETIRLHTSRPYHVYMIGFLPGFAYMGSVDEKIRTPRKGNPRTLVPAGSIGIAGEQTGIYPFDSPGGWQLIGQTPVQMFDAKKEDPCFLHPGDEVSFYAITLNEFGKMKNA
jgi:inhibitor of KinA